MVGRSLNFMGIIGPWLAVGGTVMLASGVLAPVGLVTLMFAPVAGPALAYGATKQLIEDIQD